MNYSDTDVCATVFRNIEARRKFIDAKETDGQHTAQLLALVRDLYALEDEAKPITDDERYALRQVRSLPLLARIKE